jgi:hypothetical protein
MATDKTPYERNPNAARVITPGLPNWVAVRGIYRYVWHNHPEWRERAETADPADAIAKKTLKRQANALYAARRRGSSRAD